MKIKTYYGNNGFIRRKKNKTMNKTKKSKFFSYFFKASAMSLPRSAGDSATWMPHSRMICIFAAAVSAFPPMIAPA